MAEIPMEIATKCKAQTIQNSSQATVQKIAKKSASKSIPIINSGIDNLVKENNLLKKENQKLRKQERIYKSNMSNMITRLKYLKSYKPFQTMPSISYLVPDFDSRFPEINHNFNYHDFVLVKNHEITQFNKDIDVLKTDLVINKKALAKLEQEMKRKTNEVEEVTKERNEIWTNLDKNIKTLVKSEQDLKQMKYQINDLRVERDELKNKCKKYSALFENFNFNQENKKLAKIQAEDAKIQEKEAKIQAEKAKMQAEYEKMQKEFEKKQSEEIARFKIEITRASEEILTYDHMLTDLKEQDRINKSKMSNMVNRLKNLKNFETFDDIESMNNSISVSQRRVSDFDTRFPETTVTLTFDIEVKKEAIDVKMETEPIVLKTEEADNQ